jgi:hypothetical protein
MPLDAWMADARLDAERRGLPALVPLLESLQLVLARLRAADWNDDLSSRPASERDSTIGQRTPGPGAVRPQGGSAR